MKGKWLRILSGPAAGSLCVLGLWHQEVTMSVALMAGLAAWMALWWFSEAVHHAVTALLPLAYLPLAGICDSKTAAAQYTDPIVFLFMGGFMLALGMERWGLHRRIALLILGMMGSRPPLILLGVMLSAFLISMWISNTATVMMLFPAVTAVIHKLEQERSGERDLRPLSVALLLGLAYAASIGGMSTPVGTPTNMIFLREFSARYPDLPAPGFPEWMAHALPVSALLFLFTYVVLLLLHVRSREPLMEDGYFKQEQEAEGPLSYEEKMVAFLFGMAALLWFSRADMDFGFARIPGWSTLLGFPADAVSDATVAMTMALLMFVIPSRNESGRALLEWEEAAKLPFDVVLLFGGGFAMAKGVEVSGLGNWLAAQLSGLQSAPVWMLSLGVCLLITAISEIASNVACIQLMLPVLAAMQPALGIAPEALMLPATLAASLGFMLPVATAPNTIVYSTGKIKMRQIMTAGLLVDLAGILLISLIG